jgi:hypothetical protein
LFAVIALYVNFVYFPLDKKIQSITEQRRQAEEISDKYSFFSTNSQLLDQRIADYTAQIDALKKKKDSADPQKIADSIQTMLVQSGAKALSITTDDAVVLDQKSADSRFKLHEVSINVALSTDAAGSARFIDALEAHASGAYAVDSINYAELDQGLTVQLKMRYFAPEENKK